MTELPADDLDPRLARLLEELPAQFDPRPGFQGRLETRLVRQLPAISPWWRRPALLPALAASPRAWPVRLAGAMLVLVVLGAAVLVTSPQARAQILRVACYVPGLGIAACNTPGLVALQPATVSANGVTLTVTQLLSSAGQTTLQLEVSGDDAALRKAVSKATVALEDDQGQRYTPTGHLAFRWYSSDLQRGLIYRLDVRFPALDPAVRSVQVQVTAPVPVGTLTAPVTLVPVATAGLPAAQPGSASQTLRGVTVRVVGSYADAQHTDVQLVVQAPSSLGRILGLADCPCFAPVLGSTGPITLLDDQGHLYYQERTGVIQPAAPAPGAAFSEDVLFPALPPGVHSAQLTLPAVVLAQSVGPATVTIPAAGAPRDKPIPLQQRVALGPFAVQVTSAIFEPADCETMNGGTCVPLLRLQVQPGGWQNGRQLLAIQPTLVDGQPVIQGRAIRSYRRDTVGSEEVLDALDIGAALPSQHGPRVSMTIEGTQIAIAGPWQLTIRIAAATPPAGG